MKFRESDRQKKAEKEIRKHINLFRKSCQAIDAEAFLNQNPSYINTALNSKDAFYILNIATMQYIFLNDKFSFITGYSNDELINDGWIYPEKLVLEEDRLAVCVILKEFYRQVKEMNPAERKAAIGEISYRMENKNGEQLKLLQQFQIIAFDSNGASVLEMGIVKVITHHKKDNAVTGTIDSENKITPIEPIKLLKKLKPYTSNQSPVAAYVEEGLKNAEIEDKTGIKEEDIETIRKAIIKKEDAKNMIHAIYKKNKRGA